MSILVLTANGGKAKLYSAHSPTAALAEIETFDNPGGRAKDHDMKSDSPGRSREGGGTAKHAMTSEIEPQEEEQIRFAKRLAERLENERQDHSFDRLVVVAGPKFLGLLRDHFGAPLRDLITVEMDKDYTAMRADELRTHLPEFL